MRSSVSLEMELLFRFLELKKKICFARLAANAYLLEMAHAGRFLCGELHSGIDVPLQQIAW